MSDATGSSRPLGSSAAPEEELSGWPADEQQLPSDRPDDLASGDSGGQNDDVATMSYEAARDALVKVVEELERGGTTLERSLALWERGEALAARCESWLTGARARLEAARAGAQARTSG
jgi:exodeoxyribonuclease VII small subunit